MLKVKGLLTSYYKDKLKSAKSKPMSSPSYQRNIDNIDEKLSKISLGNYVPSKTDLKEIKKNAKPRTKNLISDALNNFDSDNESFIFWNSASTGSKYASGGIDMVVKVLFINSDKDKLYRYYGLISNRLDGKVSDQDTHNTITYEMSGDGVYNIETGSGNVENIISYQVIESYRA